MLYGYGYKYLPIKPGQATEKNEFWFELDSWDVKRLRRLWDGNIKHNNDVRTKNNLIVCFGFIVCCAVPCRSHRLDLISALGSKVLTSISQRIWKKLQYFSGESFNQRWWQSYCVYYLFWSLNFPFYSCIGFPVASILITFSFFWKKCQRDIYMVW